jgi:uncharacterized protein (DUF4415 family)
MAKKENIKSYTEKELLKLKSHSNFEAAAAMSEEELERAIDEEEEGQPDWTKARLVFPETRKSVHLRVDSYVFDFFKAQGRGHLSRMQAVLKAYVDAHKGNPTP